MKKTNNKKTLYTVIKIIIYVIVIALSLIAFNMSNNISSKAAPQETMIEEFIV